MFVAARRADVLSGKIFDEGTVNDIVTTWTGSVVGQLARGPQVQIFRLFANVRREIAPLCPRSDGPRDGNAAPCYLTERQDVVPEDIVGAERAVGRDILARPVAATKRVLSTRAG